MKFRKRGGVRVVGNPTPFSPVIDPPHMHGFLGVHIGVYQP